MTKYRHAAAFCAASALALSIGAAQAGTISIDNVVGNWTAWTGGTNVNTTPSGANPAELRWGIPQGGSQSGYDFDAISPSGPWAQDVDFDLGNFTHHNFVIDSGTSITGATLAVQFTFHFDAAPLTSYTRTSVFDFAHWETPNDPGKGNKCANGQANNQGVNKNGCADRVTAITNPDFTETFEFENEDGDIRTYVFAVSGFDVGPEFWTVEQKTNTAKLHARITYEENIQPPSTVPVPASAWLLLSSLGIAGVATRRRRKSA